MLLMDDISVSASALQTKIKHALETLQGKNPDSLGASLSTIKQQAQEQEDWIIRINAFLSKINFSAVDQYYRIQVLSWLDELPQSIDRIGIESARLLERIAETKDRLLRS